MKKMRCNIFTNFNLEIIRSSFFRAYELVRHILYVTTSFAIAIDLIYLKIRPYCLTLDTQKMRNLQFLVFHEKFR